MASESFHFLFIYHAVEFVLMAFKASQERYIHLSGIITHLKDFKALERKYIIKQKKGNVTWTNPFFMLYYYNKSTKYLDGVNIWAFGLGSYMASGELQ